MESILLMVETVVDAVELFVVQFVFSVYFITKVVTAAEQSVLHFDSLLFVWLRLA